MIKFSQHEIVYFKLCTKNTVEILPYNKSGKSNKLIRCADKRIIVRKHVLQKTLDLCFQKLQNGKIRIFDDYAI